MCVCQHINMWSGCFSCLVMLILPLNTGCGEKDPPVEHLSINSCSFAFLSVLFVHSLFSVLVGAVIIAIAQCLYDDAER